jgi:hypothetical protein
MKRAMPFISPICFKKYCAVGEVDWLVGPVKSDFWFFFYLHPPYAAPI